MFAVREIRLSYNTVYLVENGGQRVLVDTGPDYDGARSELEAATRKAEPGLVVATHAHSDHAGLGRWWQTHGARVGIGRADERLVRGPHFAREGEFEAFVRYIEDSGALPQLQGELARGLDGRRAWVRRAATAEGYPEARRGERWPTGLRFEPFDPDVTWGCDADVGAGLRALLCPGHTPGNLVLVAESEGILLSGDQLLPDITPTPGVQFVEGEDGVWERFASLPAFVGSLLRLRGMRFGRCYPGHGETFDNVTGVIDQNLAQIEQRTERVLTELRDAGEATVHALAERLYPRALQRRWWQIVATVQGHLDLLASRGEAVVEGGTWRTARA